tara:strand:- start:41 stop:379 length:339 start_codon:yes stop_codon:yes gene_type:complete
MADLYVVSADKRLRSDRRDKSYWVVLKTADSAEEAMAKVNVGLRDQWVEDQTLCGKDPSAPYDYPYVATGARLLTDGELDEISLKLEEHNYRLIMRPASWKPDLKRYGQEKS